MALQQQKRRSLQDEEKTRSHQEAVSSQVPRPEGEGAATESESRGVKEARILIQRVEWAHRRLERAKKLLEEGLLQVAQSTEGPLYLCRSQSRDGQEKLYVVQRDDCPCEDDFYMEGRKLCKHILARLLLESGIPLSEIGKDPIYWHPKEKERGSRAKERSTDADGRRSRKRSFKSKSRS